MNKTERIEKLAEYRYGHSERNHWPIVWAALTEQVKRNWRTKAEAELAFLSTLGCAWLAEDQTQPINVAWHKTERLFEAYSAGQTDMIAANFRKVEIEREG